MYPIGPQPEERSESWIRLALRVKFWSITSREPNSRPSFASFADGDFRASIAVPTRVCTCTTSVRSERPAYGDWGHAIRSFLNHPGVFHAGAYFHKNFQRGNVAAALEMACLKREPSSGLNSRDKTPKAPVSRAFSQLPVVKFEGSKPLLVRGSSASLPRSPSVTPESRNPLVDFDALTGLDVACLLQQRSGPIQCPSAFGGHFSPAMVDASALMFFQSQRVTEQARLVQRERSQPPPSEFRNQQPDLSTLRQFFPNFNADHFHL
jgi:hypothetical protein